MILPKLFENLKFDAFYKPIVYISGVILVFSLVFPVIGLDNRKVQGLSFIWFAYGCTAWLINNLAARTMDAYREYQIENSLQNIMIARNQRIKPIHLLVPAIIHISIQLILFAVAFYFFLINLVSF